jgi:chromosomal replication initiation ATPase DnaA
MELSYIIKEVNDRLGIDISAKKRTREFVNGRMLYMKLAKELNPRISLSAIGRSINKNHATIIHGIQSFDNIRQFKQDEKLIDLYLNLLVNLKQVKIMHESGFIRTDIILKILCQTHFINI